MKMFKLFGTAVVFMISMARAENIPPCLYPKGGECNTPPDLWFCGGRYLVQCNHNKWEYTLCDVDTVCRNSTRSCDLVHPPHDFGDNSECDPDLPHTNVPSTSTSLPPTTLPSPPPPPTTTTTSSPPTSTPPPTTSPPSTTTSPPPTSSTTSHQSSSSSTGSKPAPTCKNPKNSPCAVGRDQVLCAGRWQVHCFREQWKYLPCNTNMVCEDSTCIPKTDSPGGKGQNPECDLDNLPKTSTSQSGSPITSPLPKPTVPCPTDGAKVVLGAQSYCIGRHLITNVNGVAKWDRCFHNEVCRMRGGKAVCDYEDKAGEQEGDYTCSTGLPPCPKLDAPCKDGASMCFGSLAARCVHIQGSADSKWHVGTCSTDLLCVPGGECADPVKGVGFTWQCDPSK